MVTDPIPTRSPATPGPTRPGAAPGAIAIGRGSVVTLPNGTDIWRVEGGSAEIYVQTSSARRLIAVIPNGAHVFAIEASDGARLLAVGDSGVSLVPSDLALRAFDPEAGDQLNDAAAGWISAIAETLAPPVSDEISIQPVEPGDEPPESAWLTARAGLVWIAGSGLRYWGASITLPLQLVPVTGRLATRSEEAVRVLSSDTLRDGTHLLEAVRGFTALLPTITDALQEADDAACLGRLTGAEHRGESGRSGGGPDAVASIAAALGILLANPLATGTPGFAGVPGLIKRAGMRGRRVQLAPGWTRRDLGPLIVEDRESGHASALIWRRGAYRRSNGLPVATGREDAYGPFAYAAHAPLPDSVKGLFSLARYLLPSIRRDGGLALMAGAGASAIGVLVPLATGWILSDIVPASLATLLFAVGAGLIASALITTIFSAARALAIQRITGRTGIEVAAAVADKILRLPTGFFRGYSAGDLNQRIGAVDELRQLVTGVILSSGMTLVFSIFYFITLLAFDSRLAGLAVILVAIYVLATLLARALQMRHVRRAAELDGKVSGASFETLAAVGKLRVAAAEERAYLRWRRLYAQEQEAGIAMGRIGAHFSAFSDAYQTVTMMTLFGAAAVLQSEDLPAGQFIGFLVAFGSFQGAFTGFCDALMSLFTAAPMAERARPVFETEAETATGRVEPGKLSGSIELSGVAFSYPGARQLLDGLDLVIQPGEHVAIVGGSGSGKSTILRLLLGFETPERGAITYDGRELNRLDLGQVRAQIGVVMQSSRLFAGSIFENIRGASEAGLEACLEAAERAGLGAELALFPMGLHTPITEGAGALSGGQKQRILIARALVGKPTIQFFDEATSALDNTTQAIVMRTLDASSATRITIAHRLSTVRNADRICVLEHGRFVEIGSFDELMAQNGLFVALAQRQLLET